MENTFCKVTDSLNQYILTDKYKQPLQCKKNSCHIYNYKQVIDDPTILNIKKNEDSLLEDTKIPCSLIKNKNGLTESINKEKINFNIYNIATINKDIVIKHSREDKYDKPYTVEEIEGDYDLIFFMDKDNTEKLKLKKAIDDNEGKEPSNEFKLNYSKTMYDYKQKLLTKEETSQKFVYFPNEIFSSPRIASFSNFKPGFSQYMNFTYNSDTDTNLKKQTEYTITLNDNYEYIVDILVVGGGGGSSNNINGSGGGGGAGGIIYIVNKKLVAGTYKIIVGDGGTIGNNGYDSMITFENNNIITLDGILVKALGGESGTTSTTKQNTGNGGSSGGFQKTAFWDGKSYVASGFKGANGGINYGGGGGGSSSEGKDIKGGDGRLIDITGENKLYGNGGGGCRITFGSNDEIIDYQGGGGYGNPGSGGSLGNIISSGGFFSSDKPGNYGSSGMPGIVIISYRSKLANYHKKIFCKVDDSNKNKYILTDKYKQPLSCINNKCTIFDIKKAVDIKDPVFSTDFVNSLYTDTKIQCNPILDSKGYIFDSEPIDKSNINFDNYNIASINKNMPIMTIDDVQLTEEQIENNFQGIYMIDKNNEFNRENITDFKTQIKNDYDYKQQLLIEEDKSKIFPNPIQSENNLKTPTSIEENKTNLFQNNNNMYIYIGIFLLFIFICVSAYFYFNSNTTATDTNTATASKSNLKLKNKL